MKTGDQLDIHTLVDIAQWLHGSVRAVRAMLRRYDVPVIRVDGRECVEAAVFQERLGLVRIDLLREEAAIDEYKTANSLKPANERFF